MGTSISAPAPRDMYQEGRDSLQAQVDLAPDIYAARAKYDPLYSQLNVDTLRSALLGSEGHPGLLQTYKDIMPEITAMGRDSASAQRAADVADVEGLGQRATTALRNSDPVAAALEDKLAAQAGAGLDAGYGLPPEMLAQVQQQVRAGQAARGMGNGGADVSVEALFGAREANQMAQQRQQFAGQVAARRRSTTGDPFMAILGRPSQANSQAAGMVGQGTGMGGSGQSFDPFNAYASDLFNTNYNAKAAAKIAQGNADTAITTSAISAAGNMGSSM